MFYVGPRWALGTKYIRYTWIFLDHVGAMLGPYGTYVGPMLDLRWAYVRPWCALGAMLSLWWAWRSSSDIFWLDYLAQFHFSSSHLHRCSLTSCFDNSPFTFKSNHSLCILWSTTCWWGGLPSVTYFFVPLRIFSPKLNVNKNFQIEQIIPWRGLTYISSKKTNQVQVAKYNMNFIAFCYPPPPSKM